MTSNNTATKERDTTRQQPNITPHSAFTSDALRRHPKVVLHDHLDGGLRPSTIIDLAADTGYDAIPTQDPDELRGWIRRGADQRDLGLYLDTFDHTIGIMQTTEALYRVAAECAQDLTTDGVIYAEVRFAPEQHQRAGLSLDHIVQAVVAGLRAGSDGNGICIGLLLCAMRSGSRSLEIAELAVRHRDRGVVGFDIAGPEAGFPPKRHLLAFQYLKRESLPFTIHAGEAFGLPSIGQALQYCGAERLGHGLRIVDDIDVSDPLHPVPGRLASGVRDRRVTLEMCPTSNLHTGAVSDLAQHPLGLLADMGFRVTVNTDNRLMSGTSLSHELARCAAAFGWGWTEIRDVTINAAEGAFLPLDERGYLIDTVIKPAYAQLIEDAASPDCSIPSDPPPMGI